MNIDSDYSWLCKAINDVNRSYFLFKLRNEAANNLTNKTEINVLELVDAQHNLIQKIDDYLHKPMRHWQLGSGPSSFIGRNSSMILRTTYAFVNENYSFGNNDLQTKNEALLNNDKRLKTSRVVKLKKRQINSGLEISNSINTKIFQNKSSLSKPRITTSTYSLKEKMKRNNNCFPFKAIRQYIKEKDKMNQ